MEFLMMISRKNCLKKDTLTRIQTVSIGKAHETTSDRAKPVFKDKPDKGRMCNYCANNWAPHGNGHYPSNLLNKVSAQALAAMDSYTNKRHCPAW